MQSFTMANAAAFTGAKRSMHCAQIVLGAIGFYIGCARPHPGRGEAGTRMATIGVSET
jgi:hypothetical protein